MQESAPNQVNMKDMDKDGKEDVIVKSNYKTWIYYNYDGSYIQADSIAKIIAQRVNHAADSIKNAYRKNIGELVKEEEK